MDSVSRTDPGTNPTTTQTVLPDTDTEKSHATREGGWGYVIVASVDMVYFLFLGWFQSPTFFFVEWQREFRSTSTEASVLVSIGSVVFAIFSPLGSVLAAWIGTRITVMTGGLLVSIGMLSTMFMDSIMGIILTWGVVTGFGFSLVFSPSISMIGQYFDEHFTLATGVAFSGGSIGQICVPLITDALIDAYGWRGAMCMLSGIMCHLIVCGAVLRPMGDHKRLKERKVTKSDNVYENRAFEEDNILDDNSPEAPESTLSTSNCSVQHDDTNDNKIDTDDINNAIESPSKRTKSVKTSPAVKGSAMFVAKSLVQNIGFDVILIVFILMGFISFTPVAHTIPIALKAGISGSKAAILPTVFGVGSLIGRLVPSFIADFFNIRRDVINISAFVTCAVGNALLPFFNTFWLFAIYHFTYSIAHGVFNVFTHTTVQVIILKEHRVFGLGLATLFYSIGDGVGAICAGWLVDVTGNYNASLWLISGLAAIGAILLVFVTILTKRNMDKEEEKTNSD
ncbi:monocarboxylate transporter 12-like [Amphiura filiformis]|uniref:monocarboxylate transporter 12-like n=1 Tax=Amphiura filiformis TaxID=82378 RepID=UPI003B2251BE